MSVHEMIADRMCKLNDVADKVDCEEHGRKLFFSQYRKSLMEEIDWLRKRAEIVHDFDPSVVVKVDE